MRDEFVSIHVGWVIDGSGGAIQSNMQLGLINGAIRSVRKMTQPVPDSTQPDMPLLDLSDCTLLPGLIDCHVHLALSPPARRKPSAEIVAD